MQLIKQSWIKDRKQPLLAVKTLIKEIMHCKKDPIYVFPEIILRGLGLNFYIHISVSDLYIPTIGLPNAYFAEAY